MEGKESQWLGTSPFLAFGSDCQALSPRSVPQQLDKQGKVTSLKSDSSGVADSHADFRVLEKFL